MSSSSAPHRLLLTVYPPDGGAARHVIDLVTGLEPAEWTIDVACLTRSEPWLAASQRENVTLHALQGSHGRPTPRDALDLPTLTRLARAADVVHAHSSKAGFLARLGGALTGRRGRVVFTPHGWSFWAAAGAEARLYRGLERRAAHWCRTVITVSEAERAAGLEAGVGKRSQYRVIPNGVDLSRFGRARTPEPGRIVWVGRLAPPKRPDIAVAALELVRRDVGHASLDMVGDGPTRPAVDALLERVGLHDDVRLLGSRADVPQLLSRAAAFVLTTGYESCPLSVIEAMAAGVPVVATAVGGIPELVVHGETGLLVEPERPDAVAAALRQLLSDPVRAEAFGQAGRERARSCFARDRMVAEVAAVYADVIADAR